MSDGASVTGSGLPVRMSVFNDIYAPCFDFQQEINRVLITIYELLDKHSPIPTRDIALGSATGLYIYFAIQLVLLCLTWVAFHAIFNLIWPKFRAINPSHKKWYVVANLSKAFFLGVQCFSPSWIYYSVHQYKCTADPILSLLNLPSLGPCEYHIDEYQPLIAKWAAAIYVMTDVLALVMVPKLPKSTIYHHVATGIFLVFVFHLDLDNFAVGRKIYLYGFWSTFSFMVNGFLALRVMYTDTLWLKIWAAFSALVYTVCCFGNWLLHLAWVADGVGNQKWSWDAYPSNVIYLGMVAVLVNDDLVLMKWLFDYATGRLAAKKKKKKQQAQAAAGDGKKRK